MLRITFYNILINKEFTTNYDFGWVYGSDYCLFTSTRSICERYSLSNLVKVEKQVKDLTADELIKLNATLIKQRATPYTFDKTKVAGQGLTQKAGRPTTKYLLDYNDKFYDLDDYVDITSLVKCY